MAPPAGADGVLPVAHQNQQPDNLNQIPPRPRRYFGTDALRIFANFITFFQPTIIQASMHAFYRGYREQWSEATITDEQALKDSRVWAEFRNQALQQWQNQNSSAGLLVAGGLAFLGSSTAGQATRILMLWATIFASCSAFFGQVVSTGYALHTLKDLETRLGRPQIRAIDGDRRILVTGIPEDRSENYWRHDRIGSVHVLLGINATFLTYSILSFLAGLGAFLFEDSQFGLGSNWSLAAVTLACYGIPLALYAQVNGDEFSLGI